MLMYATTTTVEPWKSGLPQYKECIQSCWTLKKDLT